MGHWFQDGKGCEWEGVVGMDDLIWSYCTALNRAKFGSELPYVIFLNQHFYNVERVGRLQ